MADRLAATGLLLLGGASERFGSPKALARFRGQTLAERGRRVLEETFDEVLVVGKAKDELGLPFPVLDDGSEERAPIFGLLAGLRAASHDVCVALPVDCPLVTPDLLRALAAERAVPQTGPLPGAFETSLVGVFEERIARGELSLRGVNERLLEADDRLLVNVNTPQELIAAAVAEWASERADVRAATVVGSQARDGTGADRFSDLDLLLVVDDPAPFLEESAWIADFGEPTLTFLEPTAVGGRTERRVLYADGQDVDFAIVSVAELSELLADPDVASVIRRGHRSLHDEVGLTDLVAALPCAELPRAPDERAFTELASDFWYHALWTAKKLRRGEVFTAITCLDGYMKARLVTLMGWHARALDPSLDTWHAGRFLERWADPGALAALEHAYARYDVRDVARALWATIDLFQGLEEETAGRLGLGHELDHADLRRRVAEIVPDPRRGSTLMS